MAYYKTCPHCGASLDPGETCDCDGYELTDEEREIIDDFVRWILGEDKKEAAPRKATATHQKYTLKVYHGDDNVVKTCRRCPDRADCDSPCVRAVREGAI